MGQAASRPEVATPSPNRRRSLLFGGRHTSSDGGTEDGVGEHSYLASGQTNRLSQLFRHSHAEDSHFGFANETRRRDVLGRMRSTVRDVLHRDSSDQTSHSRVSLREPPSQRPPFSHSRPDYVVEEGEPGEYRPPRLPSIDLTSTFDNDPFTNSSEAPHGPPPSSSHSSRRHHTRLNALRPDRSLRHLASQLRRRQSPQRATSIRRTSGREDQAALLSRLLSVAAAATAATLMGDDQQAMSEARSLPGGSNTEELGMGDEDGSFDGFLRALQNGRIASALRQNSEGDENTRDDPLNFFRMFRFRATAANNDRSDPNLDASLSHPGGEPSDARLVPIIIVGIRSISPNSANSSVSDELPPFIDALANFPHPLPSHALGRHGHESIDSILRPPQNGTSFRHRRRASMGAFGMGRSRINDRMDDQRDHRTPESRRDRPSSMSSGSSTFDFGQHPTTPASPSPELSRISSRSTTPSHSRPASFIANGVRDYQAESRLNSVLARASTASHLSAHTEESSSVRSLPSNEHLVSQINEPASGRLHAHRRSDTAPSVHYPRFASGHPRRNGVVEPDHLPSLSRNSTSNPADLSSEGGDSSETRGGNSDSRSWIIYVLGGSYPENHPILTTPSLFTENPTYEDMMLLSALLGPAKAPVASDEDIESAGGLYIIEVVESDEDEPGTSGNSRDSTKTAHLVALSTQDDECLHIDAGQRCLVCLCDFEARECARQLKQCKHLFHKDCIDQWLTQGRNSCPLCRSQGVDEKNKPPERPVTTTRHSWVDEDRTSLFE